MDMGAITTQQQAKADADSSDRRDRNVGILAGLTGLMLFGIMGVLGLMMRLTQANVLGLSDDWFYRIMTLHGTGMLVAALLAMMGGLWYVLRERVKLSVGRMLASYVMMVCGAIMVVVAVVSGGFAAGWTFLWPLPYESLGAWREWAAVTFILGLVFVGIGFQIYCIDLLSKLTRKHGGLAGALGINFLRGRDDDPPKPPEIAAVVVAIVGLFTLAVGVTLLAALLGRAIDTEIVIDPLWAKNLTYFFGPTLMNLIIYLGAGIIYVLVPKFAGRSWKTTKPLVIAWLFTMALVMTAYGHHLYMDFVQPRSVSIIATIASFGAALPVATVTVFIGMMLIWGSRYRWTLVSSLLYLGLVGWTIGGVGAVIDSVIPVNFSFHNTLWVPAHFHTYLVLGAMFWVMAFTVHLLEHASGSRPTKTGTVAAPTLMTLGGLGMVGTWFASGALGIPRRYAEQIGNGDVYSLVASIFVVIYAVGFAILVAEIVRLGVRAIKKRDARSEPVMAGGALDPDSEVENIVLQKPLVTPFQIGFGAAVTVVALISIFPTIVEASEVSIQWHNLDHTAVFLSGAMMAVVGASLPSVWRWLTKIPENVALAVVILTPALMLMAMVPRFYGGLEGSGFTHIAAHHAIFIVFGILTGLAASRLGRVPAWTMIILATTMGLIYAGGVSGGVGA